VSNKILSWKQSLGDLDQQEKYVRKVLSNAQDKVLVHNIRSKQRQMARFANEINLSSDEINVILFTSMDHDYFNNLLVSAGQFTEWFNLNFEGETQEEVDFVNNQVEEWGAVTTMSMMMVESWS
jgi:hypothetical protein